MSTPHNSAAPGDIAESILLPGDPLRAKYIADHFLESPVQFNAVRNILGYTGTFEGKRFPSWQPEWASRRSESTPTS